MCARCGTVQACRGSLRNTTTCMRCYPALACRCLALGQCRERCDVQPRMLAARSCLLGTVPCAQGAARLPTSRRTSLRRRAACLHQCADTLQRQAWAEAAARAEQFALLSANGAVKLAARAVRLTNSDNHYRLALCKHPLCLPAALSDNFQVYMHMSDTTAGRRRGRAHSSMQWQYSLSIRQTALAAA